MEVIWGSRHYGKTDEVPGIFHVATEFGHLYFFPLLPKASFLVLEETASGFRGVRVRFSWKSLVIAWLRAVLYFALFVDAFMMIDALSARKFQPASLLVIATTIALAFTLWRSYHWRYFRYATYERAMQLATAAGFNEVGLLAIGVHFGKITAEQADATRHALAAAGVQQVLPPGAVTVNPARR